MNPSSVQQGNALQLISLVPSMSLMDSRLAELCLQSMDVGGAGDCFFRSVSHQLYGNSNNHMRIRAAGVQYLIQITQKDLLRVTLNNHGSDI